MTPCEAPRLPQDGACRAADGDHCEERHATNLPLVPAQRDSRRQGMGEQVGLCHESSPIASPTSSLVRWRAWEGKEGGPGWREAPTGWERLKQCPEKVGVFTSPRARGCGPLCPKVNRLKYHSEKITAARFFYENSIHAGNRGEGRVLHGHCGVWF